MKEVPCFKEVGAKLRVFQLGENQSFGGFFRITTH